MKLSVKVKTGCKVEKVEETGPGQFRVCVRARPVDGQANLAVVDLLSGYFAVPKSRVAILRGHTNPMKVVAIQGK